MAKRTPIWAIINDVDLAVGVLGKDPGGVPQDLRDPLFGATLAEESSTRAIPPRAAGDLRKVSQNATVNSRSALWWWYAARRDPNIYL